MTNTAGNNFAYMLPIANFDAYTMPIRKKTIFDECLYAMYLASFERRYLHSYRQPFSQQSIIKNNAGSE